MKTIKKLLTVALPILTVAGQITAKVEAMPDPNQGNMLPQLGKSICEQETPAKFAAELVTKQYFVICDDELKIFSEATGLNVYKYLGEGKNPDTELFEGLKGNKTCFVEMDYNTMLASQACDDGSYVSGGFLWFEKQSVNNVSHL